MTQTCALHDLSFKKDTLGGRGGHARERETSFRRIFDEVSTGAGGLLDFLLLLRIALTRRDGVVIRVSHFAAPGGRFWGRIDDEPSMTSCSAFTFARWKIGDRKPRRTKEIRVWNA